MSYHVPYHVPRPMEQSPVVLMLSSRTGGEWHPGELGQSGHRQPVAAFLPGAKRKLGDRLAIQGTQWGPEMGVPQKRWMVYKGKSDLWMRTGSTPMDWKPSNGYLNCKLQNFKSKHD